MAATMLRILYTALGCVAASVATASPQDGPPPTLVHAVRAETQTMAPRVLVTGSLRAAFRAKITAREAGPVLEIVAREGKSVKAGDVLVKLDERRLRAERAELVALDAGARADEVRASAEKADAAADLRAIESASKGDAISDRELRTARTRAASAAANAEAASRRVEALVARLGLLDVRLSDATVRAPFDGAITERFVEVGEWVERGDPVVTLVSTNNLEAWFDVPERLVEGAGAIKDALDVRVGSGGRIVRATGLRVIPSVSAKSRTFPVIGSIDASKADVRLVPGMSVSAYVPSSGSQEYVTVPKDALVYRTSGVSVTLVTGKDEGGSSLTGSAVTVPVRIAFETDRAVALEPGAVQAGAVVVIEGNERLFPGAVLNATIEPPPSKIDNGDESVPPVKDEVPGPAAKEGAAKEGLR